MATCGVHRVCLALPTHRECSATIVSIVAEAAYAIAHFDVEVVVLILDSTDGPTFNRHAMTVDTLRAQNAGVSIVHVGEEAQRRFLRRVIDRSGAPKPELLLDLLLPDAVAYGACTDRVFLIAAALGCESVHRRDSDIEYQKRDGVTIFPIHHELMSLGRPASQAAADVSEVDLEPSHRERPVTMVGASYIGDMSVDIEEIRRLDPQAYYDIVSLWAAEGASEQEKRELVAQSFTGAGSEPFTADHSILCRVDPMRVDMGNISFYRVYEEIPLPPMRETIGSDYFLIHVVPDSGLPGVLHNRHVINHHTPDRKADAAFYPYHLRLAKFFLSMLYLHVIYQRLGEAGDNLLDDQYRQRPERIAAIVRDSTALDRGPNIRRLRVLDRAYRSLGGRYAVFADQLANRWDRLLDDAERDIEEFALLIEAWGPLVQACKQTRPAWH